MTPQAPICEQCGTTQREHRECPRCRLLYCPTANHLHHPCTVLLTYKKKGA